MSDEFQGEIPPIAESEKRGRKVRRILDPAYVQELIDKKKITPQLAAQLPNESVADYIYGLNIPSPNR